MIYFTSDTHFNHANIIKYSKRPFSSVEEMNEAIIKNWNKVVRPNDEIFHLGDVTFGRGVGEIKRLNGRKTFILGNHDIHFVKNMRIAGLGHIEICHYKEIDWEKHKFILFHFPIDSWNKSRHGSIHLHGHCHTTFNKYNTNRRRLDVGTDNFNYTPVSIEEIIDLMKDKPIKDLRDYETEGM